MSEPDRLKSLRRYTQLTLLTTLPVAGVTPLLVSVANDVPWLRLSVLIAGVAVLLPVHWRRLARAIDVPDETLAWRRSAVTLVLSAGLLVYAFTYADPGNSVWAIPTSVAVAELQYGRPPRGGSSGGSRSRLVRWSGCSPR